MPIEKIGEKCGVFGAYGVGFEAARLTHPGLFTLQHRGQESSGIVSSDGENFYHHIETGLVAHVYSEQDLENLKGHLAIGHNRYSTSKGSTPEHNQPVRVEIGNNQLLSLAHNGNLPSTTALEEFHQSHGNNINGANDSEMMTMAIATYMKKGASLEDAIIESYPLFTGAFSALAMTNDKIAAFRDSAGIRPLSLAKLNGGYIFSSETCAIDTVKAQFIRDIKPGEMVVAGEDGLTDYQIDPFAKQKLDLFEFIYFARPDSVLLGQSVYQVRRNLGRELALEDDVKADFVIPVLDTALAALPGYVQASGIPFEFAINKNRYIHRTFIEPEQHMRAQASELKHNPIPQILRGKDVIILDDSIVHGTTQESMIDRLRAAGANKVHVRITSSPVIFSDFYGIDTPRQAELAAFNKTIEQVRERIGADSLRYLSYEGMIRATGLSEDELCTSCFTGRYPIDIRERAMEILMPVGV